MRMLREKVSSLRRELQLYEQLLRLIEGLAPQAEGQRVVEVKVENRLLGTLTKRTGLVTLRLFVDLSEKAFEPEALARRVRSLARDAQLSFTMDEKGVVREVSVSNIESPLLVDGVAELMRQYTIDRYLMHMPAQRP